MPFTALTATSRRRYAAEGVWGSYFWKSSPVTGQAQTSSFGTGPQPTARSATRGRRHPSFLALPSPAELCMHARASLTIAIAACQEALEYAFRQLMKVGFHVLPEPALNKWNS
eukprot:2273883-Lingulodinium_polyedra.AAC.1